MRTQDFPCADSLNFSVRTPDSKTKLRTNQIIAYTLIDDVLYFFDDDPFSETQKPKTDAIKVEIVGAEAIVLDRIKSSRERNLLRIDHIDSNSGVIQVCLLEFKAKSFMAEKIQIIVDDVIAPQLHQLHIDIKDAPRKFESDVLYNTRDKGRSLCFSIGLDHLILVGTNWRLTIEQTGASGYLHVSNVERRARSGATSDGQIQLIITPSIQFSAKADIQKELNEQSNAIYKQMIDRDNGELLKLWDVYNQCELECAKLESEQAGFLYYDHWHQEGLRIIFELPKDVTIPEAFLTSNEAFSVVGKNDDPYQRGLLVPTIGEASDENELGSSEFVLIIDETFNPRLVPESGKLFQSYRGTETQTRRRKAARENISIGRCGLPDLRLLLQSGSIIGETRKHRAAVTRGLERYIFKGQSGMSFNESQRNAIDAAINTPDVAVIQGPPGTGKTQVIRALIERIREEENGEAKILVTSTQHDAVDNAIRGIIYNGVPANRAVDKKREEIITSPIYGWIDDISQKCENWLSQQVNEDHVVVSTLVMTALRTDPKTDEFKETIIAIENALANAHYPNFICSQAHELIIMLEEASVADPITEELKRRIGEQAIRRDEFIEDGREDLRQLSLFIRYEMNHPEWIPPEWKILIRAQDSDPSLQEQLDKLAEQLQEILKIAGADSLVLDSGLLKKKLNELSQSVAEEQLRREKESSTERKIASLIQDFRYELSNVVNVNDLIRSYSQLNAATNQQSVNRRILEGSSGFEDRYDYVIIDEAARSNPLDLMIPMSLGRRVILVGDQKQLPPMLEPDVTSRVIKNHKDDHPEYANLLHESLFLRLFNRMNEEDDKAGIKVRRVVMLDTQFRMHPMISDLVSKLFYDDKLKSGCTEEQKSYDMAGLYGNRPLAWLDMPAARFGEEASGKSKYRKCEVEQVSRELQQIIYRDSTSTIGVITFYRRQMQEIKKLIDVRFLDQRHRIEIGTVDSFQGKEFDYVILSTVRSNRKQETRDRIGFLDDDNRMCVAFSRARKLLLVIGDSSTVDAARPFSELLKACKGGGYYENLGA